MELIDWLRHSHYWAIAKRIEDEGRIRRGRSADWAADQSFALTIPNVYEELSVQHSRTTQDAVDVVTEAVFAVILEPGTRPRLMPAPDWDALERAGAERARQLGADARRLGPVWAAAGPALTGSGSSNGGGDG